MPFEIEPKEESFTHYTPFYYSEEDLNLARSIGLMMSNYDLANGVYNYILENINSRVDDSLKFTILPLVNNFEYFKRYSDYVIRQGVQLSSKDFQHVYSGKSVGEYVNYHSKLKEKYNFENQICMGLFPLIDLFKRFEGSKFSTSYTTRDFSDLHLYISQKSFGISLTKGFLKDSDLYYTINNKDNILSDESMYLDFGVIPAKKEMNFASFKVNFQREEFTPKKVKICKEIGCARFDVDYFIRSPNVNSIQHNFFINGYINYPLLNIFKLIAIEDSRLNESIHLPILNSFSKFESDVEVNALSRLIKDIKQASDSSVDLVC